MPYKDKERQKLASRQHYYANKETYLEKNRKYRKAIQEYIHSYKESHPCTDCKSIYPYYVMDFDHTKKGTKLNNISFLSASGRISAMKQEMDKCDLVCANCHRIRTHNRLHNQEKLI